MATEQRPLPLRAKRFAHYSTDSPLKPSRDDIFKAAIRERRLERHVTVIAMTLGVCTWHYNPCNTYSRGAFILDGVRENNKRSSVIPSYNAFNDRHSQAYFRSPKVQAMLKKVEEIGEVRLYNLPQVWMLIVIRILMCSGWPVVESVRF